MIRKLYNKIKYHNTHPEPLIKLQISQKALLSNYQAFKLATCLEIAPVLKSNAYGHGLIQVAEVMEHTDAPFLVVDSFFEALMLRRSSIKKSILIIGYSTMEQINVYLKKTSYTITSIEMLRDISARLTKKRCFHLKIDTGMRRQGILPSEIKESVKLIKANPNIVLEGLCSHFSDASNQEKSFTLLQIREWNEVVGMFRKEFSEIKYFHISATAGTFYSKRIDANVLRLGIGLYGVNPSPHFHIDIKPVLKMNVIVTTTKKLKCGEELGYNLTFKAKTDKIVAVLPVGYYEGLDRRLSNRGSVLINSKLCPIVGKICMNICMVDVTKLDSLSLGDIATIISDNPKDENSVEKFAKLCNTNPHELLVHLGGRLRRELVR